MVTIPDAKIVKQNGFVHVAVPETSWQRFEQRLSRGYHAERRWRQIDQLQRELDARKTQPARKTDREIEAELSMSLLEEVMGEQFNSVLKPEEYENLKLRVKLAQREEADRYAAEEKKAVETAHEPAWEEQQQTGIAQEINQMMTAADVVAANPDLRTLTREDLQEVFKGLLPIARSVYYKEGDNIYSDRRLILGALKQRAAQKSASPNGTASSAPAPDPAKAATPAPTASPQGKTPAARAERLNRGADAAARTTSVKAARDTRPAQATTREPTRQTTGPVVSDHEKAVDDYNRLSRAYISSNGFDIPGLEDEE